MWVPAKPLSAAYPAGSVYTSNANGALDLSAAYPAGSLTFRVYVLE